MRWLVCAGAWLAANLAGLYVAAETKWGPVVVRLSHAHGVHVGDVVAVVAGAVVAAAITAALWVTSPSRPPPSAVVRWVLVAALWQLTAVAALFVAASTDWGPVVVRVLDGKAVHLGDLVVVLLAISFATALTALLRARSGVGGTQPGRRGPRT